MTISPQQDDAERGRDQAVRRARRLRRTLVGTAAAGSGLAAVLGTGVLGQPSSSTSASAAQSSSGSSSATQQSSTSSSTTGSGSTSVAPGSGSTHASTSGS